MFGGTTASGPAGGEQTQPSPSDTQQPGGSIDPKLIGNWNRTIGETLGYRYYLFFKDDGSYSYIQITGSIMTTVTGRYTTSNGRVYLTDLVDDRDENLKDQSMGYTFGTDSDGEFLSIATILIIFAESEDEPKEGAPTKFWRSSSD